MQNAFCYELSEILRKKQLDFLVIIGLVHISEDELSIDEDCFSKSLSVANNVANSVERHVLSELSLGNEHSYPISLA
jgi:hypothetical protein